MEDEKHINTCGNLKIDIGCGRQPTKDCIGLDITQFIDNKGNKKVDIVRDAEKEGLPFCNSSAILIVANNVLEHISQLKFVLNECHRVLKEGGILQGDVPVAGSKIAFKDPTHVRFFNVHTFEYFCGSNEANPKAPNRPKYADYGFLPWNMVELKEEDDLIYFKMSPRKI